MSALIRVVPSVQSVQLQPGEWADVTLTIQNFGEVVDRYRITVEGIDPSWVTISRPELALFPKDQDQVRLTLTAPTGSAARAGRYSLSIHVTSLEQPAERTTVPFALEVPVLTALEVVLHPPRQRGVSEAAFTLQASNHGNADLTVLFEGSDPEEALLYAFEPPRLSLPAGEERQARLRVRARAAPAGQGRIFPFTVTARLAEYPQQARQLRGEWEFAPPLFEIALRPQKGRGVAQGLFTVLLTNPDSADLTLRLEGSDPEEDCAFTFDPAQQVVPGGQSASVRMVVRPKTPLRQEETSRPHAFTVHAHPADMPHLARQAQGEWVQVSPAYDIALHPARASGAAGGAFALRIDNQGSEELELQFEGSDPLQACLYAFEPSQVVVPGGQRAEVRVQVRPKALLAAKETRLHTFAITARPSAAPRHARQVQGEYEQSPPVFALELLPPQVSSASEGLFALWVKNPVNFDLTVRFEALDPEQACDFEFAPPALAIPAGQERQTQLRVRPRGRLSPGQLRAHSFTVIARPAEVPGLMQQVQGQWVELPRPATFAEMIGPFMLACLGWGMAWVAAVFLSVLFLDLFGGPMREGIALATHSPPMAGLVVDRLIGASVMGLLAGLFGGLCTGLAGRWAAKAGSGKQVLLTLLAWTLFWLVGQLTANALVFVGFETFDYVPAALVYGLVVGFLGGWASGGALRGALPRIKSGLVGLGWALGWGLAQALTAWWSPPLGDSLRPILDVYGDPYPRIFAVSLGLMGLIAGAIGGLVMLWLIAAARAAETTALVVPAWPPAAAVAPIVPPAVAVSPPPIPPSPARPYIPPAPAAPAVVPPAVPAAVPPAPGPPPPTRSWEQAWARVEGPVADTTPGPPPAETQFLSSATLQAPSGAFYALTKSSVLVGRYDPTSGETPDIDLGGEVNGMSVSRRHAWLHFREGRWQVEAISRSSVTRVGARTLAAGEVQPLSPGDVLVLGSVQLRFGSA